jgi:Family of unknown function (DUF6481)
MKGYQEPSFQDRVAAAQRAKAKALEKLRNRALPDADELARRAAKQQEREAAAAARRAAVLEARAAAEAAAETAAIEAEEAQKLSEAERKANRDARYAARKKRKG